MRLHALPALRAARRSGSDEGSARLAALLALMAHLDDTCVLHRGGPEGCAPFSRALGRCWTREGAALLRVGAFTPSTTCA